MIETVSELEDSIHLTPRPEYRINEEGKDVFVFSDGVLVAWNFDSLEFQRILAEVRRFGSQNYEEVLTQQEMETMSFEQGDR